LCVLYLLGEDLTLLKFNHFNRFFFPANKHLTSLGKGTGRFPTARTQAKLYCLWRRVEIRVLCPLVRRARRPLGTRILYQDNAEVSCHGQGWLRERTVFFSGTARNTRRSLTAEEGQK